MGRVLSLFDKSGAWAEPYRERGDLVRCLDLTRGENVILEKYSESPVDVILAAPPCTHLASSGSRWWAEKGESALLESLATVDAVFRLVFALRPAVWVIENPIGRLKRFLGPPPVFIQSLRVCRMGRRSRERSLHEEDPSLG